MPIRPNTPTPQDPTAEIEGFKVRKTFDGNLWLFAIADELPSLNGQKSFGLDLVDGVSEDDAFKLAQELGAMVKGITFFG